MAMLPQVSGIPGEIEIGSEEEAAIPERDIPHIRRPQDPPPRGLLPHRDQRLDTAIRVEPSYLRQLSLIDAPMFFWPVPVVPGEHDRPNNAQRSENVKNRPPAESQHDAAGNEWGHRHRKPAEEMRRALDAAALRSGK